MTDMPRKIAIDNFPMKQTRSNPCTRPRFHTVRDADVQVNICAPTIPLPHKSLNLGPEGRSTKITTKFPGRTRTFTRRTSLTSHPTSHHIHSRKKFVGRKLGELSRITHHPHLTTKGNFFHWHFFASDMHFFERPSLRHLERKGCIIAFGPTAPTLFSQSACGFVVAFDCAFGFLATLLP